jgi:glycerol-3-phosphate O-acyltransferase
MESEAWQQFKKRTEQLVTEGLLSSKYEAILLGFFKSYQQAVPLSPSRVRALFDTYLDRIQEQLQFPFPFQPYHEHIRTPFDYYQFGIDLFYSLVDRESSSLKGKNNLDQIASFLKEKENVILFANHQIEADPQAISILLKDSHPDIAENMIFVAGERVVTDPLAVPLSMGRNLLCIYSKRYIDNPPEQKLKKQLHNQRTMERMGALLNEGGRCIYVAPSGGRDRRDQEGKVVIAPFDPQSIEMFYLMAKKSGKPCHFFPLALATYSLLPPPETIQIELGEQRQASRGAIHLAFGDEIDMHHFPGDHLTDKHERRRARSDFIQALVAKDYDRFC